MSLAIDSVSRPSEWKMIIANNEAVDYLVLTSSVPLATIRTTKISVAQREKRSHDDLSCFLFLS